MWERRDDNISLGGFIEFAKDCVESRLRDRIIGPNSGVLDIVCVFWEDLSLKISFYYM